MTRRMVFALDLIDDAALIAAYEARHAPAAVWPDVIRDIRLRGYLDMEIWRVDDRLVMIAEVADDFPRPRDPALAQIVADWEAEMDAFQRPLHPDGDKWSAMHRIFALADQPAIGPL
ncbi:L-rhamnose mutarotase [Sphingomonas mollis]|uniref:L-rhamnose mutarotase n=1 Tax=Sphingomonas mollis TaxID=2795726 RepID=A0ABS0XM38_9SPHN|nr:L-rhamnose mutarotase [Sphingomonas sp. BT553]MBJ6121094.1 L-rhamnose mutarotase [Sphingomonas sp. BT553]